MTPNKAIEQVDSLKPNPYSDEVKLGWINDLEGMVKRLVIQDKDFTPYVYPDDMDNELLIPAPFDNAYGLYIEAMIDYYNKEYGNYNNSVAMFDGVFKEYKKAYIREHAVKG
jgi:hypothetical protein